MHLEGREKWGDQGDTVKVKHMTSINHEQQKTLFQLMVDVIVFQDHKFQSLS